MKKFLALLLFAGLLLPLTVDAQKITVKKGDVEVEINLNDMTALSEVPNTIDEAREAGSTEGEIHKGYGSMKTIYIKGKPSLKVAEHYKKLAVEGYSDEGLGNLIKECIGKGYKDDKLVECIVGKTKKKKRPHPVVKAIPKSQPVKSTSKPPVKTPPPKKLKKEADHVAKPTGAMKGKKMGGKIKKK